MVLDHHTLFFCRHKFEQILQNYGHDQQNEHPHVGLVTGGGSNSDDEKKILQEVFNSKINYPCSYRSWEVPSDRQTYISKVSDVVINLKRYLQQTGIPSQSFPSSSVPPLSIS